MKTHSNLKRAGVAVFSLIFLFLIAMIIYTNISATTIPVVEKNAGEWVPLNGNFLLNNEEDTAGYSVKIENTVIMSPEEFTKTYNTPNLEAFEIKPNEKIIILDIMIGNEGSQNGTLLFSGWHLFNTTFETHLEANMPLIPFTVPEFNGEPRSSVKLSVGKEHLFKVPFVITSKDKDFFKAGDRLCLGVTKYPERTLIYFEMPI